MRSFLCGLACAWFLIAALALSTTPGAIQTASDDGPRVLADIGRMLFVGLAILSAAAIDWKVVAKRAAVLLDRAAPLLDRMDVRAPR